MSTRTPEAVRQYADAVIETLTGDFPDLRNPIIASIVRGHIYAHAETGDRMEVIVDSPRVAMWRLVANRDNHGRVRLGCWEGDPTTAMQERLGRLNEALRVIPMEAGR